MRASTAGELKSSNTEVTVADGLGYMPNPEIKADVATFYASVNEDNFVRELTDTLTHDQCVVSRRFIVRRELIALHAWPRIAPRRRRIRARAPS